jgi:hypothetical protein
VAAFIVFAVAAAKTTRPDKYEDAQENKTVGNVEIIIKIPDA